MIKTRLINTAAAFIVGLGAVSGTVLTFAAPASAATQPDTGAVPAFTAPDSSPTAPQATQPATGANSPTVGPFSQNPYPETNPFPQLPGNPWGQ
jgi:hypothetical protein